MASKADFTEEEWDTMQKGVMGAGLLVSLADSGFFDSFKEAGALGKHVKQAHESSPSLLVSDLAAVKGTGFGVKTNALEVESETIAALKASVAVLSAKAPDDLPAYRDFVLDVAQSVAEAAKGVGAAESGAIEKITAALQPPEGRSPAVPRATQAGRSAPSEFTRRSVSRTRTRWDGVSRRSLGRTSRS